MEENFCNSGFWLVIKSWILIFWDWLERFASTLWGGLEWPHAAIVIFLVTVYAFKVEIRRAIPRVVSVGAGGVNLVSEQTVSQQVLREGEGLAASLETNSEFPVVMKMAIDSIDHDIGATTNTDLSGFVKSQLVYWKSMWWLENTYSNIYGGQIMLLKYLNPLGELGISDEDVNHLWQQHKLQFTPHMDSWRLDIYLDFLMSRNLIERLGDRIRIKPLGKEFLVWMAKFGRAEARPW